MRTECVNMTVVNTRLTQKQILARTSTTRFQYREGCMESWQDKTKATHFNQQALVAFLFFCTQKEIRFTIRFVLSFIGTIIKVLHHAE